MRTRERLDAAQHQPRVERAGHRAHRVLVVSGAARPARRRRPPARRRPRRSGRRGTWWSSGRRRRRRAPAAAGGRARRTCCRPRAARRPRARSRPAAAMSAMPSSGLVGVSHHTTAAPSAQARRTASRSSRATDGPAQAPRLEHLSRRAGRCRRRRRPGSRRGRPAGSTVRSSVSSAAMPEAKASPTVPASSAARHVLERGPGRVGRPRVLVAAPQAADAVLRVGRGQVDRHDDRAGGRVGLLAGVDGEGLEAASLTGPARWPGSRARPGG